MLFEEDYMYIAGDLLSELRLVVEGAITLFDDDACPLTRLAIQAGENEALGSLNDIGAALYLMRRYIRRLQAEHYKAATSDGESDV